MCVCVFVRLLFLNEICVILCYVSVCVGGGGRFRGMVVVKLCIQVLNIKMEKCHVLD